MMFLQINMNLSSRASEAQEEARRAVVEKMASQEKALHIFYKKMNNSVILVCDCKLFECTNETYKLHSISIV